MNSASHYDIKPNILQLIDSIDQLNNLVWLAETSEAIRMLGGVSFVPGRIGRSEPFLRHAGSTVIDEPLGEDMRGGAETRLRNLTQEFKIDQIIAHDLPSLKLARKLVTARRIPILFIAGKSMPRPSLFNPTKRLFEHVGAFICPSAALAAHLTEIHGIAPERINVIHEGVDLNETRFENVSSERVASLAQSWGAIEDASELVLIPAIFDDPDWSRKLIQFAVALSRSPMNDVRFIVVGDDDGNGEMRQIQRRIHQQARGANIQFAGHCADLEAATKLASMVLIFDAPTTGNYPLAIMAQAIGRLVVINGKNPAASEFVVPGRTGYLVDLNDDELLARIANLLGHNEEERAARVLASTIFLSQEFSRLEMRNALCALIAQHVQAA